MAAARGECGNRTRYRGSSAHTFIRIQDAVIVVVDVIGIKHPIAVCVSIYEQEPDSHGIGRERGSVCWRRAAGTISNQFRRIGRKSFRLVPNTKIERHQTFKTGIGDEADLGCLVQQKRQTGSDTTWISVVGIVGGKISPLMARNVSAAILPQTVGLVRADDADAEGYVLDIGNAHLVQQRLNRYGRRIEPVNRVDPQKCIRYRSPVERKGVAEHRG